MTVTETKERYKGVIPYICVSDAKAASKLYEKRSARMSSTPAPRMTAG